MKQKNKKYRFLAGAAIGLLLLLLGVVVLLFGYLKTNGYLSRQTALSKLPEDVLVHIDPSELPEGALYITGDREDYKDGELRLIIPALSVDTLVADSTLPEALREKPGLYEFSQMPMEVGGNVSIAGHRDIHDKVFYSLDQVASGDYFYLIYHGNVYQYQFERSQVVSPRDWSVIRRQGFTALTLTTCDPIGTAWNRLVVTARMVDAFAYTDDDSFPSTAS